jgi:hypothetical protein
VTPAQLAHLAEQADFAAGFFRTTNPSVADRFTQCSAAARQMAKNMERKGELGRIRAELADISKRIERRPQLDSHVSVPAVNHGRVDVVRSVLSV